MLLLTLAPSGNGATAEASLRYECGPAPADGCNFLAGGRHTGVLITGETEVTHLGTLYGYGSCTGLTECRSTAAGLAPQGCLEARATTSEGVFSTSHGVQACVDYPASPVEACLGWDCGRGACLSTGSHGSGRHGCDLSQAALVGDAVRTACMPEALCEMLCIPPVLAMTCPDAPA